MLEGLYKLCVNDHEIQSYEEIESEGDLPDADDGYEVYYFGSSPKDGDVMKCKTEADIFHHMFLF